MKLILTTIFIIILSISGFAQSEKFLEVSNILYSSNSKNFPDALGNSPSNTILDAQQKDVLRNGNIDYNTNHSVSIFFDKLSDKSIKSVSFQLRLKNGDKTVFKKNLTSNLRILPNGKLIGIASFYTLNDIKFDKILAKDIKINSIIFEDGTKLKF